MDIESTCFQVIKDAQNAQCKYIEAIKEAKENNFVCCKNIIREGNEALKTSYHAHSSLIELEANGKRTKLTRLLLRAQDAMTSAEVYKVICSELVDVYQCIKRGV